jgi:hypothetical protein
MGKAHHKDVSKAPARRAAAPLERVHSDICGPMRTASHGKARYFMVVVDDFTRYGWVYFLQRKDEAVVAFGDWLKLVTAASGLAVKVLRSDNGGEYIGKQFQALLKSKGIEHERTAPYTPQHNGVVERRNLTLEELARCMLQHAQLGNEFWAEAVYYANIIANIAPTKALDDITPFEAWHQRVPSVANLHVFGCRALARVQTDDVGKFDSRTKEALYLGPSEYSSGHRLWDPKARTVIVSRSVHFYEKKGSPPRISLTDTRLIPAPLLPVSYAGPDTSSPPSATNISKVNLLPVASPVPVPPPAPPAIPVPADPTPSWHSRRRVRTPLDSDSDSDDDVPVKDLLKKTRISLANTVSDSFASFPSTLCGVRDPTTYQEALAGPLAKEWQKAMDDEYRALIDNTTWDLVDLPKGRRAIGTKWVFKTKRNADGTVERYKARLVAKGFAQRKGVDYYDTFAPVARMTSIRIILAVAAHEGLRVEQLDVDSAYLNGIIDAEVFMDQPPSFIDPAHPNRVCRLQKGLYGLKQAGRIWYDDVHSSILEWGFLQTAADPCVYVRTSTEGKCILGLYVDDFIAAGTDPAINRFKGEIRARYRIKELGPAKLVIGLQLTQDDKGIAVSQSTYVQSIVREDGMTDAHPAPVPLTGGEVNATITDEVHEPTNPTAYRHIVGKAMYAMVGTRPDIAFAVGVLGRFASNPNQFHLGMAKHLLRYLKGTVDTAITFKRGNGIATFEGFCDADWGGSEDRKSTSGYLFTLNGAPISWCSKRQPTVALSSTEAEYIAATQATKEAIWLRRIFEELGHPQSGPTRINEDNQGCIQLAKNPVHHQRTKHIDIQVHFIREAIETGEIALEYINTRDQLADILTKALPRVKFEVIKAGMGL